MDPKIQSLFDVMVDALSAFKKAAVFERLRRERVENVKAELERSDAPVHVLVRLCDEATEKANVAWRAFSDARGEYLIACEDAGQDPGQGEWLFTDG